MLLSSRTPLRISFFGGGTDYPEYFSSKPGAVLGLALNQHIYINVLVRPPFLAHKYTISYSKLEHVTDVTDIIHPAVKAAFQALEFNQPVDIASLATLPSNSGLGSSASFMVGLLGLLYELKNRRATRFELAMEAIRLEREVLKHTTGVQDQLHAAFGGLNCFEFQGSVTKQRPVLLKGEAMSELLSSMFLIFTGQTRSAPEVLQSQINMTTSGVLNPNLGASYDLVWGALKILEKGGSGALESFGELLHEGWLLKRQFSGDMTNPAIDELYERGRHLGAVGGKLCGAGGGGFILFVVPDRRRAEFQSAFDAARLIRVGIDMEGTTVRRW